MRVTATALGCMASLRTRPSQQNDSRRGFTWLRVLAGNDLHAQLSCRGQELFLVEQNSTARFYRQDSSTSSSHGVQCT